MKPVRSLTLFVWNLIPQAARHQLLLRIINPAKRQIRRSMIAHPSREKRSGNKSPLVVAGLFRTASGIGEGARSTYRSLVEAGEKPIAVCLSASFNLVDMESPVPLSDMPDDLQGTIILQLNSPETPKALYDLGLTRGKSWYVIGFWAWELSLFPPGWDKNFDLVSEIWTPSTFVTQSLAAHPRAPLVTTKGHPVYVPEKIDGSRALFGLPEGKTIYLTLADALSSLDRKNPFAAIEAFKRSHADDPGYMLVVKTRNLRRNPQAEQDLRQAIGDTPNIMLMDRSLTEAQKWGLLKACDCLLSLHRSEGFGLPIAEAIALGKHVIVTAWSGNMDFCTARNATLVDYELVPCKDRYGRYEFPDAVWAETELPDLDQIDLQGSASSD